MPILCLGMTALSACGPAALPPGDTIEDASEEQNRSAHRFNMAIDRALIGPAADAYGEAIPRPVREGMGNFAHNLSQPSYVLNDILQLRIDEAARNTLRFAINSTIGLAGLLDPATAMGLPAAESDFGETMHTYGIGEGDYHVLPVLGPSTTRDTVGLVVDFAMNPLRLMVDSPQSAWLTGARAFGRFGDRHDYAETIEDVLYGSTDSYVQMRSLYLQNRRFELGSGDQEAYFDPYSQGPAEAGSEESASEPYSDPYSDPYFDPYAQ